MDNHYNKFQQFIRQNIVTVSIFAVLQIFIIVIVIALVNITSSSKYSPPSIEVSGLSQKLEDVPRNSIDVIQSAVYDAVENNGGTLFGVKKSGDAEIRTGTLINTYFEDINMHYINFVVDVPSIEQSYQVFHEWSDDATNMYFMTNMATMVMCPVESQVIYPNFDCQDEYNHRGQFIVASVFIKYFSFSHFNVSSSVNPPLIAISTGSLDPIGKETGEIYIQEVKDAISSLGISPNLFEYYIMKPSDYTYKIE